jgi:hypothetical protein
MAKHIGLDLDHPRYTPFSLMEYAAAMTEDTGIRITESRSAKTASVNPKTKAITIPAIDYSKPMTRDYYRITKGYIDHEIAHMLYPDYSYIYGATHDKTIFNLANLIDDIRIETVHSKNYVGIGEDFHHLNQSFYDQDHVFNRNNLGEKSIHAIMGITAITYYGIRHTEPFNQEVFDFLNREVFPLIDEHIKRPKPNALKTAEEISERIHNFLKSDNEPSSSKPESGSDETDSPDTGSKETKPNNEISDSKNNELSQNSKEENKSVDEPSSDTDKEGKQKPSDAAISSSRGDSESSDSDKTEPESPEPTGCDIASYMVKEIEDGTPDTICRSDTISDYHDTITDLSDPKCNFPGANTDLYQLVCKEFAPVISAYRTMFGSILISTAHCRTLKTYEGKFNHREVAHIATSLTPRLFTRKTDGRQHGYDVSLLMDCSGSMGCFQSEGNEPKIVKSYETLVVLAESLRGLSDINLEILAFTADSRYEPGIPTSVEDYYNNQLFIVKSFFDSSVGALPYFPSYHQRYELPHNNFDIGAIKHSSLRLRMMPPTNRKLLIVLSDGQPASMISHSDELLKLYVNELSQVHPILGIGLENPGIDNYYPGGVNVNDLSELSSHVFSSIRNFLISTMK